MLRQKRWTPARRILPPQIETLLLKEARTFIDWTTAVGLSPETARIRKAALERFTGWCTGAGVEDSVSITHSVLEGYQHQLAASRKKGPQISYFRDSCSSWRINRGRKRSSSRPGTFSIRKNAGSMTSTKRKKCSSRRFLLSRGSRLPMTLKP